jgi:hypothetical protein
MKEQSYLQLEKQLEQICLQLQQQNQDYPDTPTKVTRSTALDYISQSIRVLKQSPHTTNGKRIHTRCIGFCRPLLLLHLIIIGYIGFLPHASFYTCSSLLQYNYLQFDFISTPSLLKAATCIGLTHLSIMRNHTWKGWNLSQQYVYQDGYTMITYGHWTVDSIRYGYTHSLSDSTRAWIGWLNRKTHILWVLRDLFIELPVIKQVRAAAKVAEENMDHYVYRPVRQKVKEIGQRIIDKLSYFGSLLIQWGRPELGEDRNSLM